MICPECKAAGQKSTVTSSGGSTTLMYYAPYWDEDGEYHNHDMNTTTYQYKCSNGHHWAEEVRNQCSNPNCDWGKNA